MKSLLFKGLVFVSFFPFAILTDNFSGSLVDQLHNARSEIIADSHALTADNFCTSYDSSIKYSI